MGGAMKVSEGSQRLWTMDVSGRCVLKLVETGLSDGTVTELMSGGEIVEGATIVAGFKKGAVEKKERTRIFGPPKGEGPPPRF
jgi:hypothetical protein